MIFGFFVPISKKISPKIHKLLNATQSKNAFSCNKKKVSNFGIDLLLLFELSDYSDSLREHIFIPFWFNTMFMVVLVSTYSNNTTCRN